MKILITGCAGFIGYHLSKYLIKKNINVIGVDNINNYYDTKLKKDRLKNLFITNKKNLASIKQIYIIKKNLNSYLKKISE